MIFFSDLDGTFLNSKKEVGPGNLAALDAIYRAGMQFVPCTGRAYTGIPSEILEHPATRYAIAANGAAVVDLASGEVLHRRDLGHERAHALRRLCLGRDTTFDIFADGCVFLQRGVYDRLSDFMDDPYTLQGMLRMRTPYDGDTDAFLDALVHVERIAYYWRDPADCEAIIAAAKGVPEVTVVRSAANNIEVSDARATKGDALAWLCEHLGIPLGKAVAFGDHINDISMLEAVGTGVAVANAVRETRAAADAVAGSNDEDGPGAFIQQLLAQAES